MIRKGVERSEKAIASEESIGLFELSFDISDLLLENPGGSLC